jgi:hypothetical protein
MSNVMTGMTLRDGLEKQPVIAANPGQHGLQQGHDGYDGLTAPISI